MREQPPPSRNGTAPAGSPPADAYPAEWLREGDIAPPRGVGLGGEGCGPQEGCVMPAVPEDLHGEEGAISMAVNPGATDMEFVVACTSFQPPRLQVDESGVQTPMTEVTAPAPPTAGLYQDTVTFRARADTSSSASTGPHVSVSAFPGGLPCLARYQRD